MSNIFYRSYTGTIEVSIEDDCLHGRILFIDDIITYEGNEVPAIKISFEKAVDRYLVYCKETGKPANKPYSGTFNVRVGQDLHRKAVEIAYHDGITLNEFVTQSIKTATGQKGIVRVEHIHNHITTIVESQAPATVFAPTEEPETWGGTHATH